MISPTEQPSLEFLSKHFEDFAAHAGFDASPLYERLSYDSPEVRAGNALDLLPGIMASVPEETVLCIFHSFTINQFSSEDRERLTGLFDEYAMERDLFCISIAAFKSGYPQLTLLSYQEGVKTERLLANCSSHGLWLEWLEPA